MKNSTTSSADFTYNPYEAFFSPIIRKQPARIELTEEQKLANKLEGNKDVRNGFFAIYGQLEGVRGDGMLYTNAVKAFVAWAGVTNLQTSSAVSEAASLFFA